MPCAMKAVGEVIRDVDCRNRSLSGSSEEPGLQRASRNPPPHQLVNEYLHIRRSRYGIGLYGQIPNP